jgi:hypothetical protein
MLDELEEVEKTLSRVRSGGYFLPARMGLLEHLNDRLDPIILLDPLTELAGAGLAF